MRHYLESGQEPAGRGEAPLIDSDVAYQFYRGDGVESPAVTMAETILELTQTQPYLYESLEARFDKIQRQGKPWADVYFSAALKTFMLLHLSAKVWEKTPPLITSEIIKKYQDLMRSFLKNMKPKNLLRVIKVKGGKDLIFIVCADTRRPATAEIFGITDVLLPWQAALSTSRNGSP